MDRDLPHIQGPNGLAYGSNEPVESPQPVEVPALPPAVVFACSGCADTGALSDAIARRLTEDNVAKMSCLAGIGGRVRSIIANARAAHKVLVIDGCSIQCGRKTMQEAGLYNFHHVDLQELGFRKGGSPVTPDRVQAGVKAAKMLLQRY